VNKVIYITWQERGHTNIRQEYIGGGEHITRADDCMISKRVRYSSDATPAMLARANDYIRENMQDDRVNVKAVILDDQEA